MPDTVLAEQTAATTVRALRHAARRALQTLAAPVIWTCALFAGAGRLHWTRGWACVVMYIVGMSAIGLIVRHYNAGLMEARAKWRRKDTKRFDKVFLMVFLPLVFVQPLAAGLELRFHGPSMSLPFAYGGALLFAAAIALVAWSMAVNPYAESSVRIQADRGHRVITCGPYGFVRHPFYVGMILMYVTTAAVFGSIWALAVAGLIAVLVVTRTALEDQTLRRELPGYEEYTTKTRYRLLPGVW